MAQASERLQKLQKQQQQQNEIAFLNALATFKKSASDLLTAWLRADHTGDYFNADYPFNKSFDEVINDISKWEDTQNNVGFSGEAINPASNFINSILEEESKKFPKEIRADVDFSNNPHGRFQIIITNMQDEVLGNYYYDNEDERHTDFYKLEDVFEVEYFN